MKKVKKNSRPKKKPVNYKTTDNPSIVNERVAPYLVIRKLPRQTVYSYSKFQNLSSKLPLTLKEWASIIHLSDRTLQRYAKENKPFDGIYADRLLQIEKAITEAAKVFKKPIDFYYWLNEHHTVFNYTFSIASLQTQDGIHMLLDELGRIQQGVYI
jgi:uncharacterized protein (DUF2384 family)